MITKNEIAVKLLPMRPGSSEYLRDLSAEVAVKLHMMFDPVFGRAQQVAEEHLKAEFIHRIYGEALRATKELHVALRETQIRGLAPEVEAALAKLYAAIPRP